MLPFQIKSQFLKVLKNALKECKKATKILGIDVRILDFLSGDFQKTTKILDKLIDLRNEQSDLNPDLIFIKITML